MQPSNENSVGPVVGVIIILAVIVLGGLYFWGTRDNATDGVNQNVATPSGDSASAIETQSSSDDTSSIQTDLDNTNTNLDTELNAS
ncbi:hypothetical protein KW800_01105 [Candidatus Parcubacteria bacterium]|nr:hypothetical protein [Candidatus Parcubacteria bacterium]